MSSTQESIPPVKGEYCYYNSTYRAFQKLDPFKNVYFTVLNDRDNYEICNYSLPVENKDSKGKIKDVISGPFIDSIPDILQYLN